MMNNETKRSLFSKVFGYRKGNEYKTTRHLSIDCSSEEPSSRFMNADASEEYKSKPSQKFSMPLLRRLSSQNEGPMKVFQFKTKKSIFLEGVDEEVDEERLRKEIEKEAKLLERKKKSKKDYNNSPLQCRIISQAASLAEGPLDYPATPELILEHHRRRALLTPNQEWVLIELNEFECLVDSLETVKLVAKHSQFFEVDPELLWEEFFDFVTDAPSYDDVINADIWQEFRDKKYVC